MYEYLKYQRKQMLQQFINYNNLKKKITLGTLHKLNVSSWSKIISRNYILYLCCFFSYLCLYLVLLKWLHLVVHLLFLVVAVSVSLERQLLLKINFNGLLSLFVEYLESLVILWKSLFKNEMHSSLGCIWSLQFSHVLMWKRKVNPNFRKFNEAPTNPSIIHGNLQCIPQLVWYMSK